ncbi:hypothetical protein ElyMa_004883900 [Elysia marginata]|uniref:Uncharacterized protein n=1 Tax=Elysia marginata TaxID=1093978 RepID=A0AAV4IWN6_9GAST|nr:hypothetical protein ElyMa_004883900 [Elysia marginata]
MASQADAFDPRAEALAASRYRSGSVKMESMEVQPPATGPEPGASSAASPGKSTASQFRNLRTKFEEKDAAAAGGQAGRSANAPLFGSSVSRMKQKFQAGDSGGGGGGDVASGPYRGRPSDRSPENKRKKVSEGQGTALAPALDPKRRTSSVDNAQSAQHHHPVYVSPPLSPTHSLPAAKAPSLSGADSKTKHGFSSATAPKPADPIPEPAGLSEPTNHVQRFNYTMALFARMEEETRRAQERESVARRKISPSRLSITTGGTSSPILSPSSVENHSFLSPNTDSLQRARRSKSIPQENASDVRSSRPLSDSMTQAVNVPEAAKDERLRSLSGSDLPDDSQNQLSETTQEDFEKDSVIVSSDLPQRNVPQGSSDNSVPAASERNRSSQAVAIVADDPDLPPTSVLPHSSRLEHSTRPSLRAQHQAKSATSPAGLSSSALASASTSPHSRSQFSDMPAKQPGQSVSSSSYPPVSAPVVDTEVVTRRVSRSPKTDSGQNDAAKKRLSREEIESALERADTYLANLETVPDPAPVKKKTEYQRPSESSAAAARRRFLYGDAASSPSPPSSSSSSPSKRRSIGQKEQQPKPQPVSADVMVATKAATEKSSALQSAQTGSTDGVSAFDQLSSLLSDVADDDDTCPGLGLDIDGERLPPSYHEATEPPPYEVATSTASMLISQRLSQSEEQEPPGQTGAAVNTRPVPVPRRAAPPVPSHPPASRVTPPPPAPEPSSGEYVRNLRTQGNRHALILDKDTADDLVLPEEHIAHHNQDG